MPKVAGRPRLDDFIAIAEGKAVATDLAKVSGFIQRSPTNGAPVSERTEVYLGYDQDELHVVFIGWDSDPKGVRANLGRRDQLGSDDQIEIMLDTYADERRAYAFVTNPLGVQFDLLWTEGQGFDASWDTVWDTEGRLTGFGFVTRMSIPFRSLRFPATPTQTWGVILLREIQRKSEQTFWPQISSEVEGRLNQAATLTGLENISPGHNRQVLPYVTGRGFRVLGEDEQGARFIDETEASAGVDAKFVLQDRVAVDLTVNPDFGQVESDDPQVTVNQRFELFFPEKRPFFLENANYFVSPIQLLFTRRVADPELGARVTGKLGGFAVGALYSDDEAPGKRAGAADPGARAHVGVVRVNRDVGRQSSLGFLFTERRLDGDHNRVGAIDGRIKLNDNWDTRFQLATSSHPGGDGESVGGNALQVELARNGRQFSSYSQYRDVSKDFHTDLGFVPRTDVRDLYHEMSYRFRPEARGVISWGPTVVAQWIGDHDGDRLDWRLAPSLHFELPRRSGVELSYTARRERLRPGDLPGLDRDLDFAPWLAGIEVGGDFFNWLTAGVEYGFGRSVNFVPVAGDLPGLARERSIDMTLILRPTSRLKIENRYLLTRFAAIADGDGIFENEIVRSYWSWQHSNRLTFRAIVQLEDTSVDPLLTSLEDHRNLNLDLLATYQVNAWTAFYLGYNSNYRNFDLDGEPQRAVALDRGLNQDSRQVFVKASYLVRF